MPLSELKGRPAVRMNNTRPFTPVLLLLPSFAGAFNAPRVSPGCQPSRIDAFESSRAWGPRPCRIRARLSLWVVLIHGARKALTHYRRESRRVKTLRQAATTSS